MKNWVVREIARAFIHFGIRGSEEFSFLTEVEEEYFHESFVFALGKYAYFFNRLSDAHKAVVLNEAAILLGRYE